ncbi:MAG: tyrosine--tRNA ligase [Acholeplasmatales bacterium]|jgi:tyrosyl-tRNA synthetase|nr:tyrosine--tRNA ligase [Acholeplasmatales bacterium]
MSLYEELQYRGMIKDVSNETLAKDALDNKKVRFYCGFDPSGDSLTVGHLVQVIRIRLLQKYGHTAIVLIGGATGLIGDPKMTSERKLLTLENSLNNAEKIKKQLEDLLKNTEQTIFVNNYDWLKDINLISFLRDYGKYFSINYMLSKDVVQRRLETGISYTEFSYMLLQSIDWLYLYEKYNCLIQFGGSDQWGNITSGLELIKKKSGHEDAIGLSSPLLLKADGEKFGKSESGALFLDKNLTSAYEVYQYFLNTRDSDLETYFKVLTLLPKEEINNLIENNNLNSSERLAQKRLASEIVLFLHGEAELDNAIRISNNFFNGDFDNLTSEDFSNIVKTIPSTTIEDNSNILDVLVESKLSISKREAREFIDNGSISLGQEKVTSVNFLISKSNSYFSKYQVLRRGKKKFQVIIIK